MAETHTLYYSLKKLLSFFNGILALSGVVLISPGIYVNFRGAVLTRVLGLSSAYLLHVGYLCLAMGCITVLLGFAGWHGATEESRGTLLFFFLVMVIILIVEIVVATVVLVFFPILRDVALEHNFVTLRKNYRGYKEPDDYSMEWNLVVEKLKCCGVKNYTDFSGSSFERMTGHTYPRGCCKCIGTVACDGRNMSADVIHQEGYFPKLLKITKTQSINLSGGSLGAAVIQLPGILATLLLFIKLG
ncbi:tetraspanin-16 isoform X1 [Hippopotamus amphibius kiboko]|uniref:tetraspanin-16 isoform X1 n=1 Tax=Hippopotamus amphibius kiboko TaxID=575201 RepID=UPI002596E1DC|nr:tetraspanin-16 isoform X1 [Hippopotamus amphibius kiboko]